MYHIIFNISFDTGATPYPGMAAREVVSTVMMGKWLSRPLHCKQEL